VTLAQWKANEASKNKIFIRQVSRALNIEMNAVKIISVREGKSKNDVVVTFTVTSTRKALNAKSMKLAVSTIRSRLRKLSALLCNGNQPDPDLRRCSASVGKVVANPSPARTPVLLSITQSLRGVSEAAWVAKRSEN
jgi:hypothetical protein